MIFLDMTPKAQAKKAKSTSGATSKAKTLLRSKINHQQNEKAPPTLMGWKKLFANHVSDKGLICRIYKKLIQFEQ